MNRIAKFSKVSYEQFKNDFFDSVGIKDEADRKVYEDEGKVREMYDAIKLPKRATKHSAGYDFYMPLHTFHLRADESIKIPTGIRCEMNENWVLMEFPRSGIGFKFGAHLANTVGIIDSDYFHADNEGHIFVKIVNDSSIAKDILFETGDAFCQGIFVPYGVTIDDDVETERTGGLGSTGR